MKYFLLLFFFFFSIQNISAHPDYFLIGSGEISLKNDLTKKLIKIRYRQGDNQYDPSALKKINQVYGSPYEIETERMSLRFLELLSYLQEKFNGATIHILSGYRSPKTNQGLRNKGKLAAISSMHVESAAADIYLEGIATIALRNFVTSLNCCGVGYYHGKHVHIDTGPKRFWDEKTSGTEKKEPQENEKIIAMTKKDIYSKDEEIQFDFLRISDYPISIPAEISVKKIEGGRKNKGVIVLFHRSPDAASSCIVLEKREKAKNIKLEVKEKLTKGRYQFIIPFCDKQWRKMPNQIVSNEFEIR